MEEVYYRFLEQYIEEDEKNITLLKQERGLSEQDKESFLGEFSHEREDTLIVFAVLGGMFGEGIDLVGEKLIIGDGHPIRQPVP